MYGYASRDIGLHTDLYRDTEGYGGIWRDVRRNPWGYIAIYIGISKASEKAPVRKGLPEAPLARFTLGNTMLRQVWGGRILEMLCGFIGIM